MITPAFGLTATERVLPKLALDFTTASLDSRITFARTTSASNPATYIDSSGVITAATNDQPRFDYDPITLACKGLLIEESRTNAFTYSSTFTSGWTSSIVLGSDVADAPDGTTTADKVDTSTSSFAVYRFISFADNTNYAFSIFAKAAGKNWIVCGARQKNASINRNVWFDLANGVVGTKAAEITSASIEQYPNGWYRCSFVINSLSGGTTPLFNFCAAPSDGALEASTGTDGIYAWGAQWEIGAFATSYIPTTTAALTRNADVATMTGTNFSDWFNASEGTFAAQAIPQKAVAATYPGIISASNGTVTKRIYLYTNPTAYPSYAVDDTTNQATINISSAWVGGGKFAAVYKANDFITCKSATLSSPDTSGSVPSGLTQLEIGARNGGNYLNGILSGIWYFPQRLTNAELQAFTN